MEILTDVLAIVGCGLFGFCLPSHLIVFRSGSEAFFNDKAQMNYWIWSAISFALIAASVVLGN